MTGQRSAVPRQYVVASSATIALTVIATLIGLFVPGFYRDAPVLLPQVYGQDVLTLVAAVPAFAISLYFATRGSLRAYVVWLGVAGYLLYTYASYAFMTAFNELYLVYTTLLWLTLFTFVGGLIRLDAAKLKRCIGETSVRPYIGFHLLLSILIGSLWLSEILPAVLAGTIPQSITEAGLPTSVIFSFDLGIIIPAFLLTAYWLWRGNPWGYAFTAVLLVKVTTLGGAVLAMAAYMIQAGHGVPLPQIIIFGLLTLISVLLMVRFLLSISSASRDDVLRTTTESTGET